jgi:hypothetical protein
MSVRHPALTCGAGWRQGARARIDEQAFKRQGQGDSVGPRTRQRGDGPSISTLEDELEGVAERLTPPTATLPNTVLPLQPPGRRHRRPGQVPAPLGETLVGPVGLEPTTYGIQVEAERRSALLVISSLRLGRMSFLSRIESSLIVIVQRRLMGVKRGLPYH